MMVVMLMEMTTTLVMVMVGMVEVQLKSFCCLLMISS